MNYFKEQKEEQVNVVNVYIPPNIATIQRLHLRAEALLGLVNDMQDRINESVNFIETTMFKGMVEKAIQEKELRVKAKQRLLNSYRKTFNELVKQQNLVINDSL